MSKSLTKEEQDQLNKIHHQALNIVGLFPLPSGDINPTYRANVKNWYVDITNNPERRLGEHKVDLNQRNDPPNWVCWTTLSDKVARAVEKSLLNLGFDGGDGGGDETTIFVYLYLKRPGQTNEDVDKEEGQLLLENVTQCKLCKSLTETQI